MPQPIVQPLRRWDPERIGPYAIIGKLGAGGMGQVFLAKSSAGRLVAVKTIRIELAEEPGFRARFAAPARRARQEPRTAPARILQERTGLVPETAVSKGAGLPVVNNHADRVRWTAEA